MEAEKVLTKALVEDGALSAGTSSGSSRPRRRSSRGRVCWSTTRRNPPCGTSRISRAEVVAGERSLLVRDPGRAREFGLPFPKGVLLLGIPGTGKSLCAKAVAMEWGLPLLKMDPAGLYNKYVGETERNFRRAMDTAERMAPVILWIDEIEKAFAAGGGTEDGGVSTRVLGTFLSWLQDRRAMSSWWPRPTTSRSSRRSSSARGGSTRSSSWTCRTPPRGGGSSRFTSSAGIAGAREFDVHLLASETEGFSGADIEQVVVSALYTCFSSSGTLTTEALLAEARATRPLAQTMPERIRFLRQWAAERTVRAN